MHINVPLKTLWNYSRKNFIESLFLYAIIFYESADAVMSAPITEAVRKLAIKT